MKYFNIKTSTGIETIDSIDRNDFKTYKEYKTELKSMLYNYRMIPFYSGIYLSQRSVKNY